LLRKSTRKNEKKYAQRTDYETDSDIRSYKGYKAKKEFESDEIKKVEEESEARKKFKRDDSDDTEDEEEFIIEHRADPLTVINTPIQDGAAPAETQPVVKHRRILRDDN
jgi:hypothetical protein